MSETAQIVRSNPSIGTSGAIVKSFDDLARLSTMICRSGLAPRDLNTPEKVGVAIMWGMEIGLPPTQAIQSIACINNRPCVWGDALPAMVQASGVMEYIEEGYTGEGETLAAFCTTKRKDQTKAKTATFSVADAKKAGLWGKAGPWSNYPRRMLQIRARAFNFRDNAADVLRGMQVAEEQQDVPGAVQVSASVATAPALPQRSELDDFAGSDTKQAEPVAAQELAAPSQEPQKDDGLFIGSDANHTGMSPVPVGK